MVRPDKSLRILLVEDEIMIALELENVLADSGHEVIGICDNATDAQICGELLKPDLAFVDIALADGATGVKLASNFAKKLGIGVVFLTANSVTIPADCAHALGVIAKPHGGEGIRQALDYIIDEKENRRRVSPNERLAFMPFAS